MKDNIFFKFNDFDWDGIDKIDYKPTEGQITFKDVTRQNLVADGKNTNFHVRYFEVAPGGHSTLEKHQHVHVVFCVRGKGKVLVNDKVYQTNPLDMIVIPPWGVHELINESDEAFGFFCIVDSQRDKFQLLSEEEINELKNNSEVEKTLKIPDSYFG